MLLISIKKKKIDAQLKQKSSKQPTKKKGNHPNSLKK